MNSQNNNLRTDSENQSIRLEDISIFNGDKYFVFLYKKASKICTAVHLISDFFNHEEALRGRLREASVNLVNKAMALIISPSPERKQILGELSGYSLEIISLSDVATNIGLESVMNNQILKSEILSFLQYIEEREVPSKLGSGYVVQEGVMAVDNLGVDNFDESRVSRENHGSKISSVTSNSRSASGLMGNRVDNKAVGGDATQKAKGHIDFDSKRHQKFEAPKSLPRETVKESSRETVRELWPKLDNSQSKFTTGSAGVGSSTERLEINQVDRKAKIINFIKAKGDVSIKDIVDEVEGCSEKTIQRDLVSLIYAGTLKKTGERRWSKYSIINQ